MLALWVCTKAESWLTAFVSSILKSAHCSGSAHNVYYVNFDFTLFIKCTQWAGLQLLWLANIRCVQKPWGCLHVWYTLHNRVRSDLCAVWGRDLLTFSGRMWVLKVFVFVRIMRNHVAHFVSNHNRIILSRSNHCQIESSFESFWMNRIIFGSFKIESYETNRITLFTDIRLHLYILYYRYICFVIEPSIIANKV